MDTDGASGTDQSPLGNQPCVLHHPSPRKLCEKKQFSKNREPRARERAHVERCAGAFMRISSIAVHVDIHKSAVTGGASSSPRIFGTPVDNNGDVSAVAGHGLNHGGFLGLGRRVCDNQRTAAHTRAGRTLSCVEK